MYKYILVAFIFAIVAIIIGLGMVGHPIEILEASNQILECLENIQ